MKLTVLALAMCLATSSAMACSVSKGGDYLLSSGDPLLPVLFHKGKFIQCSSALNATGSYAGQVMECGGPARPIQNTDVGIKWGATLFTVAKTTCPALPGSLRHK
jgi:hypothetical protein